MNDQDQGKYDRDRARGPEEFKTADEAKLAFGAWLRQYWGKMEGEVAVWPFMAGGKAFRIDSHWRRDSLDSCMESAFAAIDRAFAPPRDEILKYFKYDHLPPHLQEASKVFADLASWIEQNVPRSAERTAGLRKLLEAKDCVVRARLP